MLGEKPADLVYLANQACIELHALLSRTGSLHQPDQLIFDLDPPGDDRFGDVRRVALRLRAILADDLGLTSFVKTTGSRGLHVLVPLNGREDFDAVREFARQVAGVLAAAEPELVTVEQRKDARGDRIYADIMRNGYAQTAVAPYSVRARPGAPVAVPLHWDEVTDPELTAGAVPSGPSPPGWTSWPARATRGPAWPGTGTGWPGRAACCAGCPRFRVLAGPKARNWMTLGDLLTDAFRPDPRRGARRHPGPDRGSARVPPGRAGQLDRLAGLAPDPDPG